MTPILLGTLTLATLALGGAFGALVNARYERRRRASALDDAVSELLRDVEGRLGALIGAIPSSEPLGDAVATGGADAAVEGGLDGNGSEPIDAPSIGDLLARIDERIAGLEHAPHWPEEQLAEALDALRSGATPAAPVPSGDALQPEYEPEPESITESPTESAEDVEQSSASESDPATAELDDDEALIAAALGDDYAADGGDGGVAPDDALDEELVGAANDDAAPQDEMPIDETIEETDHGETQVPARKRDADDLLADLAAFADDGSSDDPVLVDDSVGPELDGPETGDVEIDDVEVGSFEATDPATSAIDQGPTVPELAEQASDPDTEPTEALASDATESNAAAPTPPASAPVAQDDADDEAPFDADVAEAEADAELVHAAEADEPVDPEHLDPQLCELEEAEFEPSASDPNEEPASELGTAAPSDVIAEDTLAEDVASENVTTEDIAAEAVSDADASDTGHTPEQLAPEPANADHSVHDRAAPPSNLPTDVDSAGAALPRSSGTRTPSVDGPAPVQESDPRSVTDAPPADSARSNDPMIQEAAHEAAHEAVDVVARLTRRLQIQGIDRTTRERLLAELESALARFRH